MIFLLILLDDYTISAFIEVGICLAPLTIKTTMPTFILVIRVCYFALFHDISLEVGIGIEPIRL